MDAAGATLLPILILLAAAVAAVVVCRLLALPPIVGYLVVGLALGPRTLGSVPDDVLAKLPDVVAHQHEEEPFRARLLILLLGSLAVAEKIRAAARGA